MRELNAEGLHIDEDVLQVYEPTLDYRLEEDANESHHPVLIHLSLGAAPALVHAVLQKHLDELLRQIHLPGESVEDLECVRT